VRVKKQILLVEVFILLWLLEAVWQHTCPVTLARLLPAANLQTCREPSAQSSCLSHKAAACYSCAEVERSACRDTSPAGDQCDRKPAHLWQISYSVYNNLWFCRAS